MRGNRSPVKAFSVRTSIDKAKNNNLKALTEYNIHKLESDYDKDYSSAPRQQH